MHHVLGYLQDTQFANKRFVIRNLLLITIILCLVQAQYSMRLQTLIWDQQVQRRVRAT